LRRGWLTSIASSGIVSFQQNLFARERKSAEERERLMGTESENWGERVRKGNSTFGREDLSEDCDLDSKKKKNDESLLLSQLVRMTILKLLRLQCHVEEADQRRREVSFSILDCFPFPLAHHQCLLCERE
jgi:hypothetical protein